MRKNVIISGLVSGLIVTAMMVCSTIMCYTKEDFEGNMILGFAIMILAFSMIFVGVKNYRDKHQNGLISFGKAFKMGFYITLIASTLYVVVWLIDYYMFIPDFMEKYTAHVIKAYQAESHSQVEINEKIAEMAKYKELYKNPLYVILFTYMEILPVGLIISLIAALILKRNSLKNLS